MTNVHPPQFLPFPELVEDRPNSKPYVIMDSLAVEGLPSTGMVSIPRRVMYVPLAESGASTRRHELAHVRWSPTTLPKVEYDPCCLAAVEDARINLALERRGLGLDLTPDLVERVVSLAASDLERVDLAAFVLRAIASLGTNALPHMLDLLDPATPDALELARLLLTGVQARLEQSRLRTRDQEIATFDAGAKAAAFVAEELKSRGLSLTQSGAVRIILQSGCCLSCEAPPRGVLGRLLLTIDPQNGQKGSEDINAAEMTISEADMPIVCTPGRAGLDGRRAMREGALVRNPNRWFSDRAIFRGRARSGGGTVLVDTSASMKLDSAGVDRILKKAPGATLVAIYSGDNGEGELRIVARHGCRASADGLIPFGRGNLIDLPALKWLGTQARPRLWLSDGRVTGVHDWASSLLTRQCLGVCRRFGIRRVETAEEAAAVLDGRQLRVRPILP